MRDAGYTMLILAQHAYLVVHGVWSCNANISVQSVQLSRVVLVMIDICEIDFLHYIKKGLIWYWKRDHYECYAWLPLDGCVLRMLKRTEPAQPCKGAWCASTSEIATKFQCWLCDLLLQVARDLLCALRWTSTDALPPLWHCQIGCNFSEVARIPPSCQSSRIYGPHAADASQHVLDYAIAWWKHLPWATDKWTKVLLVSMCQHETNIRSDGKLVKNIQHILHRCVLQSNLRVKLLRLPIYRKQTFISDSQAKCDTPKCEQNTRLNLRVCSSTRCDRKLSFRHDNDSSQPSLWIHAYSIQRSYHKHKECPRHLVRVYFPMNHSRHCLYVIYFYMPLWPGSHSTTYAQEVQS